MKSNKLIVTAYAWAALTFLPGVSWGQSFKSEDEPFFFRAEGATISDLTQALSIYYGLSILVSPSDRQKPVNSIFRASSLDEAFEAISFLTGAKVGKQGSYYTVGGEGEQDIYALPSYGLTQEELGGLSTDSIMVIRDKALVDTSLDRATALERVLEGFQNRASRTLELFVFDTSSEKVDRVNAWIGALEGSVGVFAQKPRTQTSQGSAIGGGSNGSAAAEAVSEIYGSLDVQALFTLLDVGSDSRLEMRQTVQAVSGADVEFRAGAVIERPIFRRANQSDQDLVTQFDRREVGLDISLDSTYSEGIWTFDIELSDSSLDGSVETETFFKGERTMRETSRWSLLASLTRASRSKNAEALPGVSNTPKTWLGRLLTKKATKQQENKSIRTLMILVRLLPEPNPKINEELLNKPLDEM